jgi:hypothetical protein
MRLSQLGVYACRVTLIPCVATCYGRGIMVRGRFFNS